MSFKYMFTLAAILLLIYAYATRNWMVVVIATAVLLVHFGIHCQSSKKSGGGIFSTVMGWLHEPTANINATAELGSSSWSFSPGDEMMNQ